MTNVHGARPDGIEELEPLTARERRFVGAFWLVSAGSLVLGGAHVITVRAALGGFGGALVVLGALLTVNVGGMRDHGLTLGDLDRRIERWLFDRARPHGLFRRYIRSGWWFQRATTILLAGGRSGDPTKRRRGRLIESVGMLAMGLLFVAIAVTAHWR
jgi:hypothetical protein